jgi:hypothetical protein
MAVVVDDRLAGRELLVEPDGSRRLEEEPIVNERHCASAVTA